MGDFAQESYITTFHKLGDLMKLETLEEQIRKLVVNRPISLVIPALFSELKGAALPKIVQQLKDADYIHRIVISMDEASKEEFKFAKSFFSSLSQNFHILWQDSPKIKKIIRLLEESDITIGPRGKGRGAWMAFGFILAKRDSYAIALHDADIITYSREMLARLIFPVIHPGCDYEFSKGFYSRISNKMHGRVTRLLIFPLVQSISQIIGKNNFVNYFRSFRYPLAGEFAVVNNLIRRCRLPFNWGLEVGVLAEVYRNSALKRICQVDLCDIFDHKHSVLDPGNMTGGLGKMAVDITLMIFSTLASMGLVLGQEFFNSLGSTYLRKAQEFITKYYHDSLINGLYFDRHAEGMAIETFRECLTHASEQFLKNPFEVQSIPTWNRVVAAVPDIFIKLEKVVEEDNL